MNTSRYFLIQGSKEGLKVMARSLLGMLYIRIKILCQKIKKPAGLLGGSPCGR
jgi:hypothetical protein